jgi:hypothetical protein
VVETGRDIAGAVMATEKEWKRSDGKVFHYSELSFAEAAVMCHPDLVKKSDPQTCWLEDGRVVKCYSRWQGPYSEYTPDIDGRPPKFFLFRAEDYDDLASAFEW